MQNGSCCTESCTVPACLCESGAPRAGRPIWRNSHAGDTDPRTTELTRRPRDGRADGGSGRLGIGSADIYDHQRPRPADQYSGEAGTTAAPVWKPHETDASSPTPSYWISSNERGDEGVPPGQQNQFTNKAGITIFEYGTNKVLSTLNIENRLHPGGLAGRHADEAVRRLRTAGAEGHPRHPHGIEIDEANKIAWQVIEHSGLQWNRDPHRLSSRRRTPTDESGMLVEI